MKKLLTILTGVLITVLVLSFAKDAVIKASVEKGAELVTGLQLKMGSLNVGAVKTIVGIRDITLFNPSGFPDRIMLSMPEIYVDYDLPAVFKGKVHLEDMRIDLKEFTIVKNKNGELNLDSLKVVQAEKEGRKPQEKEKQRLPEMQIDKLELKIGKVVYKDYSQGEAPSVKEFNVNLSERYEDIKDPYSLVSLIVVKTLMNTTIARLTEFDLNGLKGTVSEPLATARMAVTEATAQVKETVETVKDVAEALKKTGGELKEKLKLPFGAGGQ